MEQKLVEKNQSRCIYQINEESLSFYLMIPNNSMTSLTLQITDQFSIEEVKKFPLIKDKTIIIPIININYLEAIKNNQAEAFNYLDEVISRILNLSHRILTYNHIEVDTTIFFNQTTNFATFQEWFLRKYEPRIQIVNIVTSIVTSEPEVVNSSEKQIDDIFSQIESQESQNKSQATVNSASQSVVPPQENFEPTTSNDLSVQTKEPGFVSYILLGVLAAVVSLVFLYLII